MNCWLLWVWLIVCFRVVMWFCNGLLLVCGGLVCLGSILGLWLRCVSF